MKQETDCYKMSSATKAVFIVVLVQRSLHSEKQIVRTLSYKSVKQLLLGVVFFSTPTTKALKHSQRNNMEKTIRQYNKRHKPGCKLKFCDKVAIQRTQFGTGLKHRPRYFGPYEVTNINPNDRYKVPKVGLYEDPNLTSTAADKLKSGAQTAFYILQ
ncbi:transposon Tf2-9 polyprotein [Nephila pilipes]|uniref:Transposon Tf2-9 polyprotein n=1 Tax=Nephila pilipes TaxID=299642 RepID=A0A8X6Q849_NEPPI|nr:transposon Tf2-9 polyprotein [Nephila pilipes]